MRNILVLVCFIFSCCPTNCSEDAHEYVEIVLSSSEEKIKQVQPKKTKLCWDNDWYVLSAMCLSGASGIMGAITITPYLVFEDYVAAAIYTGATGASITAIWAIPQIGYWCYTGCNYIKKRVRTK